MSGGQKARRYFGTDGIRGPVGSPVMSPDLVLRLGRAAGRVLCPDGRGKVLIGCDTRISGPVLESALEAGLASAGANVTLLGVLPTPGIAYLTRTLGARAGVVISASHNPFQDNGIKFFGPDGRKLDDATELAIEQALDEAFDTVPAEQLGRVERIRDSVGRYVEFCKSTVPYGLRLDGLRLVVDCAHGAAWEAAPAVLRELGAEVVSLGVEPDGCNINDGVGSTSPGAMAARVVETRADAGLALDGDGDRVIMADHTGAIRDGDCLLYVIARGRQERAELCGPVVGTVMSNLALEHALTGAGLEFLRSKVGDRHVLETLHEHGGIVGGESSGHILCLDRTSTGDGVISALQVLAEMRSRERSLAELCEGFTPYPQRMINVRVASREAAMADARLSEAVAETERRLGEAGRVLVRPSGTEPVIRVMVEGRNAEQVRSEVEALAGSVRACVGEGAESEPHH